MTDPKSTNLRIYYGECEHGLCGRETHLIDAGNRPLFVGDIVSLAHKDKVNGLFQFYSMSVVLEDRPDLVGEKEDRGPFVMGLRSVDINKNEEWYVHKVKDFSDCINGEHWRDYGFNYRAS